MFDKEIQLNSTELRKALAEIERAEKHGFMYCEAIFRILPGENPHWITGEFVELLEKAHPTNGSFNWGRGQGITKKYFFKDGKCVPTEETKQIEDNFPESKSIEKGKINGYKYWICKGGYEGLCGYIAFPKRPTIETGYSGILTYVPVHGGITFAEDTKFGMVYGFDTAHVDSEKYPRDDHEWIKGQIQKMLNGILMAAKVENKYLTARTEKAKAKYAQMVLDTDKEKENQYNFGIALNLLSGKL